GRTAHRELEGAPGYKRQAVAHGGERDQALDVVITVGAPAEHAQRQIDLGGRRLDARGRHAPAVRSAAVGFSRLVGVGRGLRHQTGLELLLDLAELILVGLEVARVRPLETRLELAARFQWS